MKTTLVGSKFEHLLPFKEPSQLNQSMVAHNPYIKQHTTETQKKLFKQFVKFKKKKKKKKLADQMV